MEWLVYVLFVIGFVFLIKGADLLVDGSVSIAGRLRISNLVIGLTVVAFGTSLPELLVNLVASFEGSTDIAIGNILGSNIANILLILGIASIIYPLSVKKNTTFKEIPFSLLAAVILAVLANDIMIDNYSFSILSRSDGITLLCFFAIFLYYVFTITKDSDEEQDEVKIISLPKSIIYILVGLVGLTIGGKWIVEGAVSIATQFGISESLIGLTIIAIGTSLPELATSAVAALKKNTDIAIGNVVGSNIFNVFWILGISSIIKPLPFNEQSNTDLFMVIFSSLLLFAFLSFGKQRHLLHKSHGILFLSLYVAYTAYLIYRG
ncbi:MAG: calcium/sodium antiporter [Bacteroidia bacterium]